MKKKILFLIPNLKHGGAEKVLVNLVNNLDRERYDITVQTIFDVGVHREALLPHIRYIPGMKHQFRGNSHFFKLFSPKTLYSSLVRERYDIVVSYLEGVAARIISGCTDPGIKKVCWLHTELMSHEAGAVGFRSVEEAKRCYGKFDRIIAVSQRVGEQFRVNVRDDIPVQVLYNTNESEKNMERSLEEPEDLSSSEDGLRICAIGRINEVKGFDRLLNAHRRLLADGIRNKVCILGTGEDEERLTQEAKRQGVSDSFCLLGFRENPYQYISRSDLFVCSSRREGFSTAVTEALILGVPVVSTDCSGAKELLGENNEYGIVVENSEEGIYRGMKEMLSDPAKLAHYKKQAKLRGGFFSREETVQAVEEMLDSL